MVRLLDYFLLGVPSYRLRRHGLASAPTRERFFRCVRAAMAFEEQLREPFDGLAGLDETTFGGAHPGKRGWGAYGKIIVFGILQRNGTVRLCPVARRTHREVIRQIRLHTKPGSLYYTDQWQAYASLSIRGEHVVVRKERGRPKGKDHINGIEGFWSYAKNWLYMYRGMPRKLAHVYLGEVSYRFNHRNEALFPLVHKLLRHLDMERIKPILVQIR
jgi:transposase